MTKEIIQNKYNKVFAQSVVEKLSNKEKRIEIKELEQKGYEYNNGMHILLGLETIIPYEFVLYCMLIEDIRNQDERNKKCFNRMRKNVSSTG